MVCIYTPAVRAFTVKDLDLYSILHPLFLYCYWSLSLLPYHWERERESILTGLVWNRVWLVWKMRRGGLSPLWLASHLSYVLLFRTLSLSLFLFIHKKNGSCHMPMFKKRRNKLQLCAWDLILEMDFSYMERKLMKRVMHFKVVWRQGWLKGFARIFYEHRLFYSFITHSFELDSPIN